MAEACSSLARVVPDGYEIFCGAGFGTELRGRCGLIVCRYRNLISLMYGIRPPWRRSKYDAACVAFLGLNDNLNTIVASVELVQKRPSGTGNVVMPP